MIVKNETAVIARCLNSLRTFLDAWVIIDTGSTDGTQELIREELRDIPGELFERPWVDFAHNRSEALLLARRHADFLLIIDADEMLECAPGFQMPALTADSYQFKIQSGSHSYYKTQLVRDSLDWYFSGVVHEHIFTNHPFVQERLEGVITHRLTGGARSRDPLRFRRDALLLEESLLQDPTNTRTMFYLAQSYADTGEPLLAIDRYARRIAMGGWIEEVWYSLYQIAWLKHQTQSPWHEVLTAYLAAFACRPERVEPLFQIGFHYQQENQFALAHLFYAQAAELPYPETDLLFVDRHIYDVLLPLEYSVVCFYVGRHRQAIETANRMLRNVNLYAVLQEQVVRNRQFSLDALYPPRTENPAATSRVLVCMSLEDDAGVLEHWMETLLQQSGVAFQAILIDNASTCDWNGRIPTQHPRFEQSRFALKRSDRRLAWAEWLQLAAEHAAPDDILLPLAADDRLADDTALRAVSEHFSRFDCEAMMAQFLWEEGARGNALPFSSSEELAAATSPQSPPVIAFRKRLLDQIAQSELPPGATPINLLQHAGFDRIRFTDTPILMRPRQR